METASHDLLLTSHYLTKLEELHIDQMAMMLGEEVWSLADSWSYFVMDTIGKQLIRSADLVAASIAEGYDRYHYKENLNFCFCARGSLKETTTWLAKEQKSDKPRKIHRIKPTLRIIVGETDSITISGRLEGSWKMNVMDSQASPTTS